MTKIKLIKSPIFLLTILIVLVYYQFFLFGKIPLPADTLTGSYFPWLDYKWGFPTGVAVKNPLISDAFSQFYLWKYLSIDLIKQGFWPLWNSYSFSGTPLLATYHSATLFPFNIFLFLPKNIGWGLFVFGQTLVAAFGMYFLAGLYTKNIPAKLSASLVFSLSGLMTTWIEFGTGVWAAAFLPWIFFSLIKYLNTSKSKYLYLMSISFICLYLAGHAQITFYSTALFFIFLFFQFTKKRTKKILLPIFFWLLSLGVACIQLLPTADLVNSTIRSDEKFSQLINFGLNAPYELIRLFVADFFGNPTTNNYWDNIYYAEQSSFLGTATFPLVIPLLWDQIKQRRINFWSGTFLVSLFLSIQSPVTTFLYSLPLPLLTYSSASRIFFVLSFSAGILVALAIDKYSMDENFRRKVKLTSLVFIIGILLTILTMIVLINFPQILGVNILVQNLNTSIKNLVIPLIIVSIVFIISKLRTGRLTLYILVLLLFLDLGRYMIKNTPFVDSKIVFPNTPVIDFLQNQEGQFRIARADKEILPPNTWIGYKLQSIEGYDPMALENYSRFFNKLNGGPIDATAGRFMELTSFPSKFIDAANVKYFLAVKKDQNLAKAGNLNEQIGKTNFKVVFEDKSSVVLENPNVLPRAYLLKNVIGFNEDKKQLLEIYKLDFDPTVAGVINEDFSAQEFSTAGNIVINKYQPNNVTLSTKTSSQAFLVLADSWEKGWSVLIDGKPSKLLRVNLSLRGVFVPAGEHIIEYKYWPTSFALGLKISIISLVVLCIFPVLSLIRVKK